MNCRKLLPWIACPCETCGAELHQPGICGGCLSRPPAFDCSIIPFGYQEPVASHIQQLKYAGRLHIANAFGEVLSDRIVKNCQELPDTIVAIPLHWRKICKRGFNQSTEIAKVASSILGIPLHYSLLRRTVNTMSQTGLSEKNRLANIRGAFCVSADYRRRCNTIRHVAVVDDVVTSGATVSEAARVLKQAGAGKVTVWAIAKTSINDL
jgi:ComF family protein